MKINLLQGEKARFLGVLTGIQAELRGIRVVLELMALKERAVPDPDEPEAADFSFPTDEELADYEAQAAAYPRVVEEEVEEETKLERPVGARPVGSFGPRFNVGR